VAALGLAMKTAIVDKMALWVAHRPSEAEFLALALLGRASDHAA
jgi:hypothetical protein